MWCKACCQKTSACNGARVETHTACCNCRVALQQKLLLLMCHRLCSVHTYVAHPFSSPAAATTCVQVWCCCWRCCSCHVLGEPAGSAGLHTAGECCPLLLLLQVQQHALHHTTACVPSASIAVARLGQQLNPIQNLHLYLLHCCLCKAACTSGVHTLLAASAAAGAAIYVHSA